MPVTLPGQTMAEKQVVRTFPDVLIGSFREKEISKEPEGPAQPVNVRRMDGSE